MVQACCWPQSASAGAGGITGLQKVLTRLQVTAQVSIQLVFQFQQQCQLQGKEILMRDCSPAGCHSKPKATPEMPLGMGTTPPDSHRDLTEQSPPVPSWNAAGSTILWGWARCQQQAQALGPDSSAGLPQAPAAHQSHEPCTAAPASPAQPD